MSDLEYAIECAAKWHEGQVDKNGEPYILHPLRVMLTQTDETSRIVAVLHDAVEDCNVGHGDILALFGADVWEAVCALTKTKGEPYDAYLLRVAANPIARRVKLADLADNMDPKRRPANDNAYDARMARYQGASKQLQEAA